MTPFLQLLAGALVLYVAWKIVRSFFRRRPLANIPGPVTDSYLMGNLMEIFGPDHWGVARALTENYGRLFKIHGMFNADWLYTYDPRAFHSIFVKQQDVFEEDEVLLLSMKTTLGPGLLATVDQQHRRQRKMLNPLFSAKHLREMTPIFDDIVHRLRDAIASRVKAGAQEIDMLGWMGRTALELIGQGGLGHSFDPLTRDVPDEFADAVKSYFPVMQDLEAAQTLLLPWLVKTFPATFRRRLAGVVPYPALQRAVHIADAMHNRSMGIYNEKKSALEKGDQALKHQVGEGKDIMSVLLRANMTASEEDRLPDEEVIAQVSTLVLAAMDTTSNALARILHLLSENPDVQQKLREEIIRARDDGSGKLRNLDYDEIMELPYLDAVCRETLRRHPPVAMLVREVRKDALLPLSAPIHGIDGTLIESVTVTKGMKILTDITASNCNPELWGEDAYEWKPERWLKPLPRELEDAHIPGVYSHLMTFIGGARACIGFKFSQLEMKVVLATLLPVFKFSLTEKPIYWNPAGVAYPSTIKGSRKPEMPLKVTLL